jgi:hypothetical protein
MGQHGDDASAPRSGVDASTLREEIRGLEAELFQRLREHHKLRRWLNADPELVRVWGRIKDNLGEIERLVERPPVPSRVDARLQLRDLLGSRPRSSRWQLEFAREFDHSPRVILPYFGDDTYLLTWLRTNLHVFNSVVPTAAAKSTQDTPSALASCGGF